MKNVLLIPKNFTGIIDTSDRKNCFVVPNVEEQNGKEKLTRFLYAERKSPLNYKYCQFNENEIVPQIIRVVDKISSSGIQEFEIERVSYKDLPLKEEEKQKLIENKYKIGIANNAQPIMYKLQDMLIDKMAGDKIDEEQFLDYKIKKDEYKKKLSNFNYKEYLDKLV